jgi:hypothetical protein
VQEKRWQNPFLTGTYDCRLKNERKLKFTRWIKFWGERNQEKICNGRLTDCLLFRWQRTMEWEDKSIHTRTFLKILNSFLQFRHHLVNVILKNIPRSLVKCDKTIERVSHQHKAPRWAKLCNILPNVEEHINDNTSKFYSYAIQLF